MLKLKLTNVVNPFTPAMRRILRDALKPTIALGKRLRDPEADREVENVTPQPFMAPEDTQRNCVALQNEDAEEDAVVITALNTVPFCCHADLLLMQREQLVEVAESLNAKLPLALEIDVRRSDVFIRNSIEVLVGIRHVVPEAPRANRSLSLSVSNLDFRQDALVDSILPLNPVSPMRNRSSTSVRDYAASPRLAALREENEELTEEADRPPKRRRIDDSSPDASPTPVRRKVLKRSQSDRVGHVQAPMLSARDNRVLRSRSERLPFLKLGDAHRNITLTRGGRACRKPQNAVITSTPRPHRSATLNDLTPLDSRETISVNSLCTSSSSTDTLSTTPRLERVGVWLTRTDAESDARGITTSMQELSVGTGLRASSSSDMDMSM